MNDAHWQKLVDEYYDAIFRFALHMLADRSDAEDATQQTFLKAFRSLSQLQDEAKSRAWLYAIARNVSHDHLRSLKRIVRHSLEIVHFEAHTSPVSPVGRELLAAIQRLPRMQREVFLLREWHDFSTHETAEALGIADGSVKSHLSRAKSALQKMIALDMTSDEECPPS